MSCQKESVAKVKEVFPHCFNFYRMLPLRSVSNKRFRKRKRTRKFSSVNARGIPPAYTSSKSLGGGYLPWPGRGYLPLLGGTYLGRGVPTLTWGGGVQTKYITFPHPSDAGGYNLFDNCYWSIGKLHWIYWELHSLAISLSQLQHHSGNGTIQSCGDVILNVLPLAWSLSSWTTFFFHSSIFSCIGFTSRSRRELQEQRRSYTVTELETKYHYETAKLK